MTEDLKNFRVNWIDGMKISKNHFIELQNYVQELGRDITSLRLNSQNYGLLPTNLAGGHVFEVNLNAHNSISISIQRLRAITPNGSRIEINELTPKIETNIIIDKEKIRRIEEGFIVLSIDSNSDNTFGKPNLEEVPPRLPLLTHKLVFSIIDKEQIASFGVSPQHLPLAKFSNLDENIKIEEKYLLPCLTINANLDLVAFNNNVLTFFNKVENNSIRIVKKIRAERNKNAIADLVQNFSSQLLTFLGSTIPMLHSKNLDNTPLELVNAIKSMARIIKNHIDTYSPNLKESTFIYFGEWVDLAGGDFEKLFTKTVNLQYNHYDMSVAIKEIDYFIKTMSKLFDILTEIDYIGKKKDTGLFVNERQVSPSKSDNKPSFFAD